MLISLLRRHRYELIAFLTGAAVMMLEVVGARLTAPFFGSSTYVWTAIIGVILGALAGGYALGGILADKYDPRRMLTVILVIAAFVTAIIGLIQRPVLSVVAGFGLDLRLGALLSAVLLFGPASLLVGLVSPHLAKIRVDSLETSGKAVGRLEAAGAIGSIVGTFACGYFLLGLLGSRLLVFVVALILLSASFLAAGRGLLKLRLVTIAFLVSLAVIATRNPPHVLADIDTPYDRYTVSKGYFYEKPALFLGHEYVDIQSAVDATDPRKLIVPYIQRFDDAARSYGSPRSVLAIGGGAYTFPSQLVERDKDVQVDVVEIDGTLRAVAAQYFALSTSPRLRSYNEDGRTYLNRTDERYDMVFVDAFTSLVPPFQLTTREAVQGVHRALRPGGAAVVNIVDDTKSPDFARALVATYGQVFKQVALYPAHAPAQEDGKLNFILYASDNAATFGRLTNSLSTQAIHFSSVGMVLTDDHAPVEQLLN